MEIMKVRSNASEREAGQNPTDTHRQQTQERSQLYFLLSTARAWAVVLISVSLEVSLGKMAWWHIAILKGAWSLVDEKVRWKAQLFISKICMQKALI